jgi:hypothetical protein
MLLLPDNFKSKVCHHRIKMWKYPGPFSFNMDSFWVKNGKSCMKVKWKYKVVVTLIISLLFIRPYWNYGFIYEAISCVDVEHLIVRIWGSRYFLPFTLFWCWIDFFKGLLFIKESQRNISIVISGSARFSEVPPSVLYVSSGGTARFVWDYTVDNRTEEFDAFSPKWSFYNANDVDLHIGQESVYLKWKWLINIKTCPARLLNPVRVSKASTATLVIYNVTSADSGTYGCTLVLTTRRPIISKVQLVVTCKFFLILFTEEISLLYRPF